jgi:threonine/homoserine/homoserine lactone efflux protein
MLLVVGLGLAKIFIALPMTHLVLKYISIVYLLYLAWRIATASSVSEGRRAARPMTLLQGMAFQWVNVKGWVGALGAVTTYTVVNSTLPLQIAALSAISLVITVGSVSTWTLFGAYLRRFLHTEERRRWFNYSMAGLLVLSIVMVFLE